MTKLLVIDSTISGDLSVTRELVQHGVAQLEEAYPGLHVTHRDLNADPIPHLTSSTVMGVRGVAASSQEREAQRLSDTIVGEVQETDILVIGAPMYNFSVPTTLRAYFDYLLRPQVTFAYTEAGPQGLLVGKRAIVIEARGGVYSEGPTTAFDFQEPYIRHLLAFIGITDVTFIRAEKIGYGPEARVEAIALAKENLTDALRELASAKAPDASESTTTIAA
jgi:FMN-dependent NADH-azoreductase